LNIRCLRYLVLTKSK